MTNKEIIEFNKSDNRVSDAGPVLELDPDLNYVRVNEDEDPDIRKIIGASQAPVNYPCFIAMVDGKIKAIASGELPASDIKSLLS